MGPTFNDRLMQREFRVGVVGIGYVGLPLAVAFAGAGFPTVGIDVNPERVAAVNEGQSYIDDVSAATVKSLVTAGLLRAAATYEAARGCDAVFICVPTPYTAQRMPDLSYIVAATEGIAPYLRRGQLIVLQSTTYPGTTTEIVQPILERGGLLAESNFYLAFSPERVDPGNRQWGADNTPKVVGGVTPEATARAAALLRQIGAPVHEVSSPATAEFTKLLENTFRAVNIALVNELAQLAERMRIDIWEVIEAARTKPFGFMAFTPGPGVGGHCIPIDPHYLMWKAREYDFPTRFIELAAETNEAMPYHVVDLTAQGLNLRGKSLKGAEVLVLGVAFKPNISDARDSPAERIIELLLQRGARVRYHDPHVPQFRIGGNVFHGERVTLASEPLTGEVLSAADAVVIVTGHRAVDYAQVVQRAALVIDSCNATRGIDGSATVVRLGAAIPR